MEANYRQKCLRRKGEECARCGGPENIEVHHIDRDRSNNELSNLLPLCKDCHNDEHESEMVERASGAVVGYRETYGKTEAFREEISELHSGPWRDRTGSTAEEDAEDMRDVDWRIVDELRDGRNNAPNIAETLGYSRQYIAERLGHLKTGDVVEPIGHGIYELVPEEVPEDDDRL